MTQILSSIKKIVIASLMIASVYALVSAASPETVYAQDIVITNTANINVRSLPSTNSAVLGKLDAGIYLVRYEERVDGWSYIDYAGTPAYIKSNLLTFVMLGAAGTAPVTPVVPQVNPAPATTPAVVQGTAVQPESMVWLPASGKKYHSINNCGRMNPDTAVQVKESSAISQGYEKCSKCY